MLGWERFLFDLGVFVIDALYDVRDSPHSISRVLNQINQTIPTIAFSGRFASDFLCNQCMAPVYVSSNLIEVQRIGVGGDFLFRNFWGKLKSAR